MSYSFLCSDCGFGKSKPEQEIKHGQDHMDTAILPLAVTSIAGLGAIMGAVLFTENSRYIAIEQTLISIAMLAGVFVSYLLMLATV